MSQQSSDKIDIGPLLPSEHDALVDLMRETWTAAFASGLAAEDVAGHLASALAPNTIRRYIAEDGFLAARVDGCMIGFVQYGRGRSGIPPITETDMEVRRLYVDVRHQSRGIGSRLLQAALDLPEVIRAPRVLIDVWQENHGAQRLYARFGFVRIGEIPFVVDGRLLGREFLLARAQKTDG